MFLVTALFFQNSMWARPLSIIPAEIAHRQKHQATTAMLVVSFFFSVKKLCSSEEFACVHAYRGAGTYNNSS